MNVSRPGERLSAADASNVTIDATDQVNVFLLAGILGAGGFVGSDGSLDLDKLRADIDARLRDASAPELARLSRRIVTHAGRLVWQPCEPNLVWHVRLADPGSPPGDLTGLCARLMVRPLPADRPRWELLVVPGAAGEPPGLVFRAHHALADGVAAVRLAEALFGSKPSPSHPPIAASDGPPTHVRARRAGWRQLVTGVARVAAMVRGSVGATVLLGPIGSSRGVGFAEVDLAPLAEAANRAGGTVNDALLAAVAAAAVAGLRARGQPVPPVLPASVPVSLPERAGSGNAVGVMMVELPTDQPDATERLARIAQSTRAAKNEARASGTFELTRTRWGSRVFARLARRQRFVVMFVTNVRGPATGLAIGGAPLLHAWPVTPIQGNVRLGVSALSYRGRLACCIHTDADALDAALVAGELSRELALLAG